MAMLRAYLDESGDLANPHQVISVAAVVATQHGWHTFEEKWTRILRRYRVPGLHLHMTDFENRRGAFADWPITEEKRVLCIAELAATLKHSIRFGYVVSMDLVEWGDALHEAFREAPDYAHAKTPLIVLLQTCLEEMARSPQLPSTHQIACFFERTDFLKRARVHFENWVHQWRLGDKFKSFTFAGKYDFPGLQGADMLAYEGRKDLIRRLADDGRPERKLHAALDRSKKIMFQVLDRHAFDLARR